MDANPFLLGSVYRVRMDQRHPMVVHRHNFFEPCFILKGKGIFQHGHAEYPVQAGDLIISDPGVFHEIHALGKQPLELFFTSFSILLQSNLTSATAEDQILHEFLKNHLVVKQDQGHLSLAWEYGFRSSTQNRRKDMFFVRKVLEILVLQIMTALTTQKILRTTPKENSTIEKSLAYIDQHLERAP
jgi:hypothetical protein